MSYTLMVKQAFVAADGVYETKRGVKAVEAYFNKEQNPLNSDFDFTGIANFRSKTGAFFHANSGFALAVTGKTPATKGQAIVAFRGTKTIADTLTDLHTGVQLSRTGEAVHAGFNRTFKPLADQVQGFLTQNAISTVHCVGHSLGGALATLAAEHFTSMGVAQAKLYTIGSPRVGFVPFSQRLTRKVSANHIYRLHHDNDFVSMVPLWPFTHVPQPGASCNLNGGVFNTFSAHFMSNYLRSIDGVTNWESIRKPDTPMPSRQAIEHWLSAEGAIMLSRQTLRLLGVAIEYIFKTAGISMQAILGLAGLTVLDKLSYLMHKAYDITKGLTFWVTALIRKILSLFGKTLSKTQNITVEFIRYVFNMLHQTVSNLVRLTLSANENNN